ncbi:MAG: fibronectin type III domain-containing protein [Bacteroidota bacterium]
MRILKYLALPALLVVGCSEDSTDVTAPIKPLVAPSDLVVTRTGLTAVRLTWSDNNSSEESFAIERKQNNGEFLPRLFVTLNSTSARDTLGLFVDTTYTYRIRALRYFDEPSPYSNTATIFLTPFFP